MEKLTQQEEQLMLIVWQKGKGFIKDFIVEMPKPAPPYTTVASIAKNLERKGFLNSKMYGNTYEYSPSIDENEYKKRFLSGVAKNYFQNSYKEMVTFFAKEEKLSEKDLQEILELIKSSQ